jgi:hypothetical protein
VLEAEVTLMWALALCTRVQMPNATSARTMNSTMMMMAMVSFFFKPMAAAYDREYRRIRVVCGYWLLFLSSGVNVIISCSRILLETASEDSRRRPAKGWNAAKSRKESGKSEMTPLLLGTQR